MVTCYDEEYKATKSIVQGKAVLEPLFAVLADWVAFKWQVKVLNVIYDHTEAVPPVRPRLQVIVEHSSERQKFFAGYNFDPAKQRAISDRFAELVHERKAEHYELEGLIVVFSAFAPLARQEADSQIADADVEALQQRIANPALWTIHRCFGRVVFFFFTDEQAQQDAQRGLRDAYADLYFEVLKKRDEFKYLRRDRFGIEFDSKENFDKNYRSNWYFYDL